MTASFSLWVQAARSADAGRIVVSPCKPVTGYRNGGFSQTGPAECVAKTDSESKCPKYSFFTREN